MIVSNSTVLIYLGKLNRLSLLKAFFKKVAIPNAVFEEVVVQGKKGKHVDALLVEQAIEGGWIEVKGIAVKPGLEEFGIDRGEAEGISLSLDLKAPILLDQTHARIAAKAFGLRPRGTLFVLLKALKQKTISFDEFIECMERLIDVGFRMDQEVYLQAIKEARKIAWERGIE